MQQFNALPQEMPAHRDAPPKRVAQALEQLGHAGRLMADVRLGADRLLEALFILEEDPSQQTTSKCLNLLIKEDSLMRQHLQNLRSLGKQLEESGVLTDSLRSRSDSWGLHMPLVCPDGAVVAYAWKRQLAGQAGASAVDRTRLALQAFTDQKRRFFPHLTDDSVAEPASKKQCSPVETPQEEDIADQKSLAETLSFLEKEVPGLQTFTYQRLDWFKRASSLASTMNEKTSELSKDHSFSSTSKWRQDSFNTTTTDEASVIELFFPRIFRAVVSLHTAGSMDPDAVALFSPDEGGSHMHARGFSLRRVFRHVSEHASLALQYFICRNSGTSLLNLLHWICSYQSLFSRVCSKCNRLMVMDKQSGLIFPPVKRQFRNFVAVKSFEENRNVNPVLAFHIGCFSEEP